MPTNSKSVSIIDEELKVEGTISCDGKLIIKGTLEGTLLGDEVIIAKEGVVTADARVKRIAINGIFKGELNATHELAILANGNCSGKVICKDLIIESGGVLNAEVVYMTVEDVKPESDFASLSEEEPISKAGYHPIINLLGPNGN